ncbi:response regulator transcription factor [Ktedonosporobacter rubrisoli]|nr:response regulator [Ktedonosporobacter rubrisoli]
MYDQDAANNMPESGKMDCLNGTVLHESDQPAQEQYEGQHIQQRILVVEDDPTLASLEADILTAHGYTVISVNSGEQAIATLRHFVPNLVVLDLELTGPMHGLDVLQALRASTSVPVLLTTSSSAVRSYIHSHGETKSTLDHLPKPYPMQTLLKRVKRMLTMPPH